MPLSLLNNKLESKAVEVDEMRTWQYILDRILSDEKLSQMIISQADKRILRAVTFASMILNAHQQFQTMQLVHKSLRCIEYLTGENLSREIELADLAAASNIEASALVERLGEIIFDKSLDVSPESASLGSIDRCTICNQVLLWDSLTGAYCPSGHLFGMFNMIAFNLICHNLLTRSKFIHSAKNLKTVVATVSPMASPNNSRKPSISTSSSSSNNNKRSQTIDRFDLPSSPDEADPDKQIANDAIAAFNEYPYSTAAANKDALIKHHFRSGSVIMPISSGNASLAPSSIEQDASTQALKSPRGSISTLGNSIVSTTAAVAIPTNARKPSVASGASASSPEGFPASEVIATTLDGDSPTLGRFPPPPKASKRTAARDSMLLSRYSSTTNTSTKAVKSPISINQSPKQSPNPTINTQSTTTRAERGLNVPFLPKFLKLAGSSRQSFSNELTPSLSPTEAGPDGVDEIPQDREREQALQSVFESESSLEDAGDASSEDEGEQQEEVFIGGAKLAARRRPILVEQRSSFKAKQNVSLRDMLVEGGVPALHDRLHPPGTSVLADVNPGPSKSKAKKILGDNSIKFKRAGIVGLPAAEQTTAHEQADLLGREEPVKVEEWTDGLRSNPVKIDRKITLPLEIKDESRGLRQSIVSTPYPLGYKGKLSGKTHKGDSQNVEQQTMVMLVLYSYSSTTPVIKKVVVPEDREMQLFDNDEKRPQFRAKMSVRFDDEKLFKLLRKEYRRMRGFMKMTLSARSVYGISLLGYHRLSQLAPRDDRHGKRKTFRVYDDVFTEARMMKLWQKPKLGRKKFEWVDWARRMPKDSEVSQTDDEKIALELVEGWCVRKIVFAVSAAVMLSILATLLWVFLGYRDEVFESVPGDIGGFVNVRTAEGGFRGAAIRVETGVALGVLVLLLGWTCVGAWVLLSWMVM
ncbi:MAG: hypothetical protein Q9214_001870 [Letrouitia sp. 1 TL-2023]